MNDIYKLRHLKIPKGTTRVIDIKARARVMISLFTTKQHTYITDLNNDNVFIHADTPTTQDLAKPLQIKDYDPDTPGTLPSFTGTKIQKHDKFVINNISDVNRLFRIDCHLTLHTYFGNTEYYKNISKIMTKYNKNYIGDGWTLVRRVTPDFKAWHPSDDNLRMTKRYIYKGTFTDNNDILDKMSLKDQHRHFNDKDSIYTFSRTAGDVNISDFNEILFASSKEIITPGGNRIPEKWLVIRKSQILQTDSVAIKKSSEQIEIITGEGRKRVKIFNGNFPPLSFAAEGHDHWQDGSGYLTYSDLRSGPLIGLEDIGGNINRGERAVGVNTTLNNNPNQLLYAENSVNKRSLDYTIPMDYTHRYQKCFHYVRGSGCWDKRWRNNYENIAHIYDENRWGKIHYLDNINNLGGMNVFIRYNPALDRNTS